MTISDSADPTKASKLAQQIITLLINEEPGTRQRAIQAAMMLLGEPMPHQQNGHSGVVHIGDDNAELAAFFSRDVDMKPADNAHLCAAYHYSLYGAVPFSLVELKVIAADAGVVIPDRVDMTLKSAMHKGKKLFQNSGVGHYKPTAAACVQFAERWKVKPSRKVKQAASGKEARVADL